MAISNNASSLRTGVCTSTTRPTAPYTGQTIYETDTNMMAIWNGSAWRYVAATTPTNGTVLQVVSNTYSTETSTTSLSWVTTGLNASITPKSTSSKVLVIASLGVENANSSNGSAFTLFRGTVSGTNLGDTSAGFGYVFSSAGRVMGTVAINYLDSPSTTSSQTYTVGMYAAVGSTVYAQRFSAKSVITLMEIAG